MKKLITYSIFLIFLCSSQMNAQLNLPQTGRSLEGMFNRLRENVSTDQKLKINDSINLLIGKYSESDSVFIHKFSNLRFLGQITSPDSLVKIITWNLILESGENHYFCYFIRKASANKANSVYRLGGTFSDRLIRTDTIYSDKNWYGALYYDLRPLKTGQETCYVLLGIDYGNSFITKKIIDVLTFGQDNSLVFGRKWFVDGKVLKNRIIFEYASKVVMSLRFYTDQSIVFDHLSPSSPEYQDNHQFWGPDFTFDSYNFENGFWRLKSNVDIRLDKSK
jgi:hypothetical protein